MEMRYASTGSARGQIRAAEEGAGQACGYNLFGTGSVGAVIVVKYWLDDTGCPGTVQIYGPPAASRLPQLVTRSLDLPVTILTAHKHHENKMELTK